MITGLNIEHYWIITIQLAQFAMTLAILKKLLDDTKRNKGD